MEVVWKLNGELVAARAGCDSVGFGPKLDPPDEDGYWNVGFGAASWSVAFAFPAASVCGGEIWNDGSAVVVRAAAGAVEAATSVFFTPNTLFPSPANGFAAELEVPDMLDCGVNEKGLDAAAIFDSCAGGAGSLTDGAKEANGFGGVTVEGAVVADAGAEGGVFEKLKAPGSGPKVPVVDAVAAGVADEEADAVVEGNPMGDAAAAGCPNGETCVCIACANGLNAGGFVSAAAVLGATAVAKGLTGAAAWLDALPGRFSSSTKRPSS